MVRRTGEGAGGAVSGVGRLEAGIDRFCPGRWVGLPSSRLPPRVRGGTRTQPSVTLDPARSLRRIPASPRCCRRSVRPSTGARLANSLVLNRHGLLHCNLLSRNGPYRLPGQMSNIDNNIEIVTGYLLPTLMQDVRAQECSVMTRREMR